MARPKKPPRRPKVPRPKEPEKVRRDYALAVRLIADDAIDWVERHLEPKLEGLTKGALQARGFRVDDEQDELRAILEAAGVAWTREWGDKILERVAATFGERLDAHNLQQFRITVHRSAGVDVPGSAPHIEALMRDHIRANVDLIKTIPATYFAQVRDVVERGWREGKLTPAIADEIAERGDVARSRAEVIARDQMNKLNGQLDRDRTLAILGDEAQAQWSTAKDGRVRPSHAALEGRIYSVIDGVGGRARFPGHEVQCRCIGIPVMVDPITGEPFDITGGLEPLDLT